MKNLILGLFVFGLTTQVYSQITELPEVVISPVNYRYLYTVDTEDIDENVRDLEELIAKYDVTKADYYDDEYENYQVSFFIPEGYAVAAYDKNGKLLKTIERYNDVELPTAVNIAVGKRFPNWSLSKDVYKVSYSSDKTAAKKVYKLKLSNGDKKVKVKVDEDGNFL